MFPLTRYFGTHKNLQIIAELLLLLLLLPTSFRLRVLRPVRGGDDSSRLLTFVQYSQAMNSIQYSTVHSNHTLPPSSYHHSVVNLSDSGLIARSIHLLAAS